MLINSNGTFNALYKLQALGVDLLDRKTVVLVLTAGVSYASYCLVNYQKIMRLPQQRRALLMGSVLADLVRGIVSFGKK